MQERYNSFAVASLQPSILRSSSNLTSAGQRPNHENAKGRLDNRLEDAIESQLNGVVLED